MKHICMSLFVTLVSAVPPSMSRADEALVGVATNFAEVMEQLEARFEQHSGHDLTVVAGSTGKLYAQITNGAPFDVFLAADRERPRLLEERGLAVDGTRLTYAVGRLVLWSPEATRISADGADTLRNGDFRRLAMANPALAPYGAAARQTLEALGLYERLGDRLVLGENIGQAFAMVATANAELGFVALSYVTSARNEIPGSRWDVPQEYYTPIRQDAVLLERGTGNDAAAALLRWLREDEARAIIERFGYRAE